MARLGAVIAEAIVHHYGRDEFLRRLAHPFWFQSFGAVMGMDWHSSGITTSVIGALKRGLQPLAGELGLHVCGGRGAHSRQTPAELVAIGERVGFDGAALARASRLVAKVDSAAVQDGFDLYLHGFIVADDGHWVVVQQGMNGDSRQARRYHWLSEGLKSFVEAPHAAIEGPGQGEIVNLTDRRAAASRRAPARPAARPRARPASPREVAALEGAASPPPPEPAAAAASGHAGASRRPARGRDRCAGCTARWPPRPTAAPEDFAELLLVPGVGARTVHSLAMVAEVVHGAPCRFADPGALLAGPWRQGPPPLPVPTLVYDQTIAVLKSAVAQAKLGNDERLDAIRRLDDQARRLERHATGPTLPEHIAVERRRSHEYGGRSVFGWEPPPAEVSADIPGNATKIP